MEGKKNKNYFNKLGTQNYKIRGDFKKGISQDRNHQQTYIISNFNLEIPCLKCEFKKPLLKTEPHASS